MMGENESYAVGHLALGYILSKTSAKMFKTNLNIPLILTLSVIADIDLLIPTLQHRGPTHSIIMMLIFFAPFFAIYHKKETPYFIALIQHSLIGDYLTGEVQLLWPITTYSYGVNLSIQSQANITIEWMSFAACAFIMIKNNDVAKLLQPHISNLTLTIPTFTVLLPTFLSFPLKVPYLLIPPHLFYIVIFLVSITIDLQFKLKRQKLEKGDNEKGQV